MKLTRDFFERDTLAVAKELLGKEIVFHGKRGMIIETEAYIGKEDPACHAARGKTPRTQIMFGPGGFSYVYFIYGMYYCLNFVTEKEFFPAAVLIRAVETSDVPLRFTNGPGKLCKYFGITKEQNAIDLCTSEDFFILDNSRQLPFIETPRIGISKGQEHQWRFLAD